MLYLDAAVVVTTEYQQYIGSQCLGHFDIKARGVRLGSVGNDAFNNDHIRLLTAGLFMQCDHIFQHPIQLASINTLLYRIQCHGYRCLNTHDGAYQSSGTLRFIG